MTAKQVLDMGVYKQILAKIAPVLISSDEEHTRILAEFEKLFDNSMANKLSPEEEAVFELLAMLIERYEKDNLVKIKSDPVGMLKFFMEQHDKQPKDLWEVLGSKGLVSELLNGTRRININHAKKLAKFFNTAPEHFIDLD